VNALGAYAGPGCPRCWTPLPKSVLESRDVYCGTCGLDFEAEVFEPSDRPRADLRAPEAGTSAQCARHARNAAAAACERCGAFMCTLCRVESDGLVLCAACFDRLRAAGALASARNTFRSWRTLGLHLSVLGLFLSPFGVVIGPVALFAAARGISQDRKNGDEGGLTGSIVSLVLGTGITGVGIVFVLSMMGALR
jgi:hypothetical protein